MVNVFKVVILKDGKSIKIAGPMDSEIDLPIGFSLYFEPRGESRLRAGRYTLARTEAEFTEESNKIDIEYVFERAEKGGKKVMKKGSGLMRSS